MGYLRKNLYPRKLANDNLEKQLIFNRRFTSSFTVGISQLLIRCPSFTVRIFQASHSFVFGGVIDIPYHK